MLVVLVEMVVDVVEVAMGLFGSSRELDVDLEIVIRCCFIVGFVIISSVVIVCCP